jgi:hypothetical protein
MSVNGYTGQVWHHAWHGSFISEKEFWPGLLPGGMRRARRRAASHTLSSISNPRKRKTTSRLQPSCSRFQSGRGGALPDFDRAAQVWHNHNG